MYHHEIIRETLKMLSRIVYICRKSSRTFSNIRLQTNAFATRVPKLSAKSILIATLI